MLSLPLSTWLASLLGTALVMIGICLYHSRRRIRRMTTLQRAGLALACCGLTALLLALFAGNVR